MSKIAHCPHCGSNKVTQDYDGDFSAVCDSCKAVFKDEQLVWKEESFWQVLLDFLFG